MPYRHCSGCMTKMNCLKANSFLSTTSCGMGPVHTLLTGAVHSLALLHRIRLQKPSMSLAAVSQTASPLVVPVGQGFSFVVIPQNHDKGKTLLVVGDRVLSFLLLLEHRCCDVAKCRRIVVTCFLQCRDLSLETNACCSASGCNAVCGTIVSHDCNRGCTG